MQWTHAHEDNETDAVFAHVEWANTTAGIPGQAIMFYNAGTPFNADRSLSISSINTLDKDLTGYRVGPTEWHASILQPVPCGILNEVAPASNNNWIASQSQVPVNVQVYGRTTATAFMSSARQAGVALIPDESNIGALRDVRIAEETLDERDFATEVNWTYVAGGTDTFATTGGAAEYTYVDTGTGSLTQAAADLLVPALPLQKYVFEFQCTISDDGAAGSFGGTPTITTAFAQTAVSLPVALGFHRVMFTSAESPGAFVIAIAAAGAGDNWAIDNLSLKLADDDSSKSHLIMAQTIADWAPENILANRTFSGATSWTTAVAGTDTWTIVTTAPYVYGDTGDATLTQTAADRTVRGLNNRRYRFTFNGTAGGGFDGTCTITNSFAATATALPITTGRHVVEFDSAAAANGADFVIDIASASVGTWTLDNFLLELIEDDVRVIVRCM